MKNVENIRIVDATMRDGGLVNDHRFDDLFVNALYKANLAAGVDYMEFGYRADKKMFSPEKFGKWKFSSDEDIWAAIGGSKDNGRKKMKICVMADVGRCDYKEDIHRRSESPVDLIRVATYIDTIPEAIQMIEYADKQGYETTCNLMAISNCTYAQLVRALNMIAASPVIGAYIVDSYGALYPKEIRRLTRLFKEKLGAAGKLTGIHAHNNQQCAFANTVEAMDTGARLLDGTAFGMGRGAGNCNMEALLGYLNGKKYHIEPLLDLVENKMLEMKESGAEWGYNTSYLLTGLINKHPRDAIAATKKKDINYKKQYQHLTYEQ